MIHHPQRLPLRFEAGNDRLRVRPELDRFQREATADGVSCLAIYTTPEPPSPGSGSSLLRPIHSPGVFSDVGAGWEGAAATIIVKRDQPFD